MVEKILVAGGLGNVGLLLNLHDSEKRFINASRTPKSNKQIKINPRSISDLICSIKNSGCSSILLLSAMSNNNDCENDNISSCFANIELPQNFAIAAKECNRKLIFVSTDYIYNGDIQIKKTELSENIKPINLYGLQKYCAENIIKDVLNNYLILRISRVYNRIKSINFLHNSFNLIKSNPILEVAADQYFSPIFSGDLYSIIISLNNQKINGTFNCSGPDEMSRYEYFKLIKTHYNLICNLKPGKIRDLSSNKNIPCNTCLNSDKVINQTGIKPISFKDYLIQIN